MNRLSIRWRLILAGAVLVPLALALAAWGLAAIFDRHVTRVALGDMAFRLERLAVAVGPDGAGALALVDLPADPQYDRPYSGHYWQIALDGVESRSRSLWDYALPLPPALSGQQTLDLPGPRGERLLVLDQTLQRATATGDIPLRISVALDRVQLDAARRAFVADLLPYLALLALVLVATGAAQLAIGLRPFSRIRQRLAAVSQGAARRMGSDLPAEVLPLAAQIDSLLDAAETETDRARSRAADLAHGLKTPLQALLGEAGRLKAAGSAEAARGVTEIVDAMQAHVDRELSRARRAADRARAQALPLTVARAVAGVLMRTPDGAALDWRITGDDLPARIDPADLTEALGALAENAARHAASRVEISCAALDGARLVVVVRDDGPGVDIADPDQLLQRGMRLDARGGGGLGLSIAAEILTGAGGGLTLDRGDPGLVARLVLLRSALPGKPAHEAR